MAASRQGGLSKQMPKILTYSAILVVILLIIVVWGNTILRLFPVKYEQQVKQYAQQYNLDANLVYALVNAESHFNPNAQSGAGAKGLMQLMPDTAQWIAQKNNIAYSEDQLFDPEKNIQLGCVYFAYLLNKFDYQTEVAVAAYNGGEGKVQQWLNDERYSTDKKTLIIKNIPYEETKNYVKRVMRGYDIYERLNKNK